MKIEVSLSPALYPFRTLTSHVTVALDVLRATTAICAAFQSGCQTIVPLDTLEQLPKYRSLGYLLAAERNGEKVANAHFGNSPTEYLRHDLTGVRLAYSTTNGTMAILLAANAKQALVGAFANLSALSEKLVAQGQDTVILCSGWKNDICIEDTLLAGAILERTVAQGCAEPLGDAAHIALALWQQAKDAPFAYCQKASHVHRLYGFGAEEDVRFAFRQDTCPIVPIFADGRLTI